MDNNDFILKIVAELEQKGIKTGFDKLKKELEKDPAKIDVIIDTSGTVGKTKGSIKKLAAELHNELSVEISKLQKQGKDINFDLSVGDVEEVIQNVINHTKKLEQNFDSASAKAQKFLAQFNKKSGGVLINSDEFKAVQTAINGLGNTHTIDDLNKSMNTLEVTYNNMVSSLRNSGKSLNPFINAKNEMAVMDETIKGIGLEFEKLSTKPKSVADSIKQLSVQQSKVNSYTIGTQEWADAYGKLQQMIQKVNAEISNLSKAKSANVATHILNTEDLDKHGKIYIQKISNTIEKTKSELESKLRNVGYTDIEIKGVEDAKGKIKSLTATVTDATGAFKQLSFERAKIQGNGKAQAGFVQTDDVKVVGNISSAIDKIQNNLSSLKAKWEEQCVLVGNLKTNVEQLEASLSSVGNKDELNGLKSQIQDLKNEASTLSRINEIQLSMDGKNTKSKNYDYQIDTEIKKLKDLGFTDEEVTQKVKILTDAQAELKRVMSSSDFDSIASKNKAIIESDKERTTALNQVRTAYGQLKNDASQYYNLNKQTKLSTDIQNWLSKNSRASKEAKESLNAYYRELSDGRVSVDRLNYIEQELKSIDATQRGLGKLGKNLKDQFKEAGASFTQWLSVSSGIMALVYQLQKMPKEVIKVNSAMVELNKVSDASASDIAKYFDEAAISAKRYGSSVSDLISATADWSRLGYSLPDSKKLAEVATLYKNVGDGIDIATANESLVSTLQGFKLEANDAMHIIDAFNEVGNNFAIGSDGIGEALKRSASSMYAAGNTLEETIGLVTAANAVVQDPDSIGTAYKTISMRIRSAKTEMEELGLETEGMVESTATLQKEILDLSGVDIMKDENTFKSTYQILDELATKWQNLTDIQQASITELIAGKRQGNIVSALMSNFETARQATETAINSTGSALKEQEAYEQGIQYSLDRLEASFQTFANHILDSNFLKGIIDFGNGTINVLDSVTDKLGFLGTIGLAGAGYGISAFIKNLDCQKALKTA